jgi:hypothetical protein
VVEDGNASSRKPEETACRHYWDIQPPTGYISEGCCRYCGATKEFRNSNTFEAWTKANKQERAQPLTSSPIEAEE